MGAPCRVQHACAEAAPTGLTGRKVRANGGRMIDLRPVGYVIGLLVGTLGITMLLPLAADLIEGRGAGATFGISALITVVSGVILMLACANSDRRRLTIQQTFLLTSGVWAVLPIFGAIPFVIGAPNVSVTDAVFEAMSGFTTTGSTVFTDLDTMPWGTLLWRGIMQWIGGIGIIVVAMAFLPALRIGGMQIFRSEAFDTMGKVLPRAAEIALSVSTIYLGLTLACFVGYSASGMGVLDATVHAMTTIATGGFANSDQSFAAYKGSAEYIAAVFMILASLPFVRYVQFAAGTARPLLRDSQVRAFVYMLFGTVLVLTVWRMVGSGVGGEPAFREALFNTTSIATGTGYASANYELWGGFAVAAIFLIGLVGGCAGSTCCSVKIFRYQIVFAAIQTQIRRLHNPHGVFSPRYQGRQVDDDVLNSVMAFFVMFILTLSIVAVILAFMGVAPITAISGAATALANIGPGLGPEIGPAGNFSNLPDQAKWVLIATMLVGRLELMSIYVLFTITFWRR